MSPAQVKVTHMVTQTLVEGMAVFWVLEFQVNVEKFESWVKGLAEVIQVAVMFELSIVENPQVEGLEIQVVVMSQRWELALVKSPVGLEIQVVIVVPQIWEPAEESQVKEVVVIPQIWELPDEYQLNMLVVNSQLEFAVECQVKALVEKSQVNKPWVKGHVEVVVMPQRWELPEEFWVKALMEEFHKKLVGILS